MSRRPSNPDYRRSTVVFDPWCMRRNGPEAVPDKHAAYICHSLFQA
jgi:hypothetical protein